MSALFEVCLLQRCLEGVLGLWGLGNGHVGQAAQKVRCIWITGTCGGPKMGVSGAFFFSWASKCWYKGLLRFGFCIALAPVSVGISWTCGGNGTFRSGRRWGMECGQQHLPNRALWDPKAINAGYGNVILGLGWGLGGGFSGIRL